jgi:hypothetical protein
MRFVLALVFCAAVIMSCDRAAAATSCALRMLADLRLTFTPSGGSPAIQVQIDRQPMAMRIETDNPFSVLSARAAAALGLHPHIPDMEGATVELATARLEQVVTPSTLQIGGLTLQEPEMFVPGVHASFPADADGLIGWDILRQTDVELDFGRARLKLFSSRHCSGGVVYWNDGYGQLKLIDNQLHHIQFNVLLDGKSAVATIASNEPTTRMRHATAAQRFHAFGAAGMSLCKPSDSKATFQTLIIDGITIAHPAIDASCGNGLPEPDMDHNADLSIGQSLLRKFRIYIASSDGNIYFIPQTSSPSR